MKKVFLILFLVSLSVASFAQKEGWNWYFGATAGIDFSGASPVAHTNGALTTSEGCSSISDSAGNLLFYTDGSRVWDRTHSTMPNGTGLMGNSSASQSAVIVPKPGTYGRYFIFTVPAQAGAAGLRYTEVDMSIGVNGDVINATKNTLLHTPTTEKITATKHANGIDFWVVSHDWNSDAFRAHLVTATGVNPVPVITNIGITHTGGTAFTIGYMKISPNGNRIAIAPSRNLNVQVADFNKATGVVSNIYTLTTPNGAWTYGVEFSPNSNLLYVTNFSPRELNQFDLTAGTPAAVQATGLVVGTQAAAETGAVQLGPDGKLYVARRARPWVGVVNFPDVVGLGCNYVDNGVDLLGRNCNYGLPVFMSHIFNVPTFTYDPLCLGDSTAFTISDTAGIDSVRWIFGDLASGPLNQSVDWAPKHVFTGPGTYTVQLIVNVASIRDTMTEQVTITNMPNVALGADDTLCDGDVVSLDAGNILATYVWSTGDSTKTISVDTTGTYSVTATYGGVCSHTDSIYLQFNPIPTTDLGPDTSFCVGGFVTLDAGNPGANYTWSTTESTQTINVSTTGTYWVMTSMGGCSDTDSVDVTVSPIPAPDLGNDTIFCDGPAITLDPQIVGHGYAWSTGDTTATISVDTTGTYIVTVTIGVCNGSDTMMLTTLPLPVVSLSDQAICAGASATFDAGNAGASFSWQPNGETTQTITASTPGVYTVTVDDGSCTASDSAQLTNHAMPTVNLGVPITKCPWEVATIDAGPGLVTYNWSTGEGSQTINVLNDGTYWVWGTDVNGCNSDTGYKDIIWDNCARDCDSSIFIPNVFTPGHITNEIFMVRGYNRVRIRSIQVFNRWGEVVFERREFDANDPFFGWDGTYKGNDLPPQVFAYYVKAECQDGTEILRSGNVTLIR